MDIIIDCWLLIEKPATLTHEHTHTAGFPSVCGCRYRGWPFANYSSWAVMRSVARRCLGDVGGGGGLGAAK